MTTDEFARSRRGEILRDEVLKEYGLSHNQRRQLSAEAAERIRAHRAA